MQAWLRPFASHREQVRGGPLGEGQGSWGWMSESLFDYGPWHVYREAGTHKPYFYNEETGVSRPNEVCLRLGEVMAEWMRGCGCDR